MKSKKVIAVLTAAVFLTACGKISETSEPDIAGNHTSDASVTSSAAINTSTEETFETLETNDIEDKQTSREHILIEPQCGPSFGFSFDLPDGWSYEAVQTEDEPTSSTSAYLKPDNESEGRIIIEYTESGIGICGTNLNEEIIVFNDYSAVKGTYHNSDNWDFIFLNGDYSGCAVLNNASEWYDDYEDEIEYILSTVEFMLYE